MVEKTIKQVWLTTTELKEILCRYFISHCVYFITDKCEYPW